MTLRSIAWGYVLLFVVVTSLNYVPGLTDANGLTFGIFRLNTYNDVLHGLSGMWAAMAALGGARARLIFFRVFGTLYCLDGLMGLALGTAFLDFSILTRGIIDLPFGFKLLANLPHIAIGGSAAYVGFVLSRRLPDSRPVAVPGPAA